MTATSQSRRRDAPGRVSRVVAVAVLASLALLPLVVAAAFGAWGLPRNDDWSYSEMLWRWAQTGDLRANGYEGMSLVGQLAAAWPIGRLWPDNAAALQVLTAAVGFVGVVACYTTLRRFLSTARALLASGVVLLSPVYAPLAASFMTDVPAFTAQAGCAWFGTGALVASNSRKRVGLLAAAVVVGLFGTTIREYAVVTLVVVLLLVSLQAWGQRNNQILAAGAVGWFVTFAFLAVFLSWRRSWKGSFNFTPEISGDVASSFGRSLLFTIVTLAFLVLPVMFFVPARRLWQTLTEKRGAFVVTIAGAIVLAVGAITAWDWSPPLLSPYLDQRGALGDDILPGDPALLMPRWLLAPLLLLTLASTVALVGVLASTGAGLVQRTGSWRARCASIGPRAFAWVLVVLSVLALTAVGTTGLPVFDRYVLPAVPFAAGLVLAWQPDDHPLGRTTPANYLRWAGVVAFAVLGLTWSADSAGFDAARWRAGERAVELGYRADRVDAGFEWRNVHRLPSDSATSPFQRDLDACVRVAAPDADLGPDAVPLLTVEYWHGASGAETLTAWAVPGPDCEPPG